MNHITYNKPSITSKFIKKTTISDTQLDEMIHYVNTKTGCFITDVDTVSIWKIDNANY